VDAHQSGRRRPRRTRCRQHARQPPPGRRPDARRSDTEGRRHADDRHPAAGQSSRVRPLGRGATRRSPIGATSTR
jgi:hypothetical protein